MAGDAGSPQNQPTDLSLKSRNEGDELKAYDYGSNEDARKSHFKFKRDMAAYYATFDKPCDLSNKSSVIKSTEGAIRNVMNAMARSLTPQGNPTDLLLNKRTPSDEEIFVYSNARMPSFFRPRGGTSNTLDIDGSRLPFKKSRPNSTTPAEPKSASYMNDKAHLYSKIARERPIQTTPSDTESKSLVEEKMSMRPADRPQSLDLQKVTDMSPDSGLGSATPIFGSISHAVSGSTTSPETPSGTNKFGKRRKRKYGPGRGWKFHDLSNDGGSNRKRVYAQNKLENGVLQRFQEHVCVKSVSSPDGSKDRLIIVEPSEIHDSDIIRAGTALRVVFDKDAGTYRLQLLPFTLEEGPLSDHDKVLQAVSKMLGFNNEVLCPNAFKAIIKAGSRFVVGDVFEEPRSFTPPTLYEGLFDKTPTSSLNLPNKPDGKSTKTTPPAESPQPIKSTAHQRDALLWSLNNELKKYNTAIADAAAAGRKTCLMWHTPQMGLPPGKKRYVATTKYCANCRPAANLQQST